MQFQQRQKRQASGTQRHSTAICCTLDRWHTGACMHEGEGGLTVPRVTRLLPSLPPEMARVTLPVGEGEPEADTLIVRDPRQLGKVNPASHRHALSDSHPQQPTYTQARCTMQLIFSALDCNHLKTRLSAPQWLHCRFRDRQSDCLQASELKAVASVKRIAKTARHAPQHRPIRVPEKCIHT